MSRRQSTTTAPTPETPAPVSTEPAAQTVIVGRLTRDPQLRQLPSGKAATTIRVAINREGQDAEFLDVVAFGKTAEVVCRYLKKGRLIEAHSSSDRRQRTWTGRDGAERSTTEVLADRIQFVRRSAPTEQAA